MNFSNLDKLLNDQLWYYGFHGCDAGVIYKGKIVYRKQFGVKDFETGEKMSGNELYYIYSATKPITCVGALRLVERGLLDVNAPVSKYFPEYENIRVRTANGTVPAKNVMTVKHLFTMTAGFGYDLNSSEIRTLREKNPEFTAVDLAKALAEFSLFFEPGEGYNYSLCHDVLAGIVEKISDMPFSEYQQKNIFEPLGMTRTRFHLETSDPAAFAARYRYDPDKKICEKINDMNNVYELSPKYDSGGAGLICCTDDYLKFLSAMSLGGTSVDGYRLLKRETVDFMRQNHLSKENERIFTRRTSGYSYGLGVRTMVDPLAQNAKSPLGEFGWDGAACSYLLIDPDNQIGVFYAQHVMNCGPMYIMGHPAIRDAVYEALEL